MASSSRVKNLRELLGPAAVAVVLLVAAAALFAVPVRTTRYLHDSLICLEGGWRMVQGMKPGADFHSPLGPTYLGLLAVGLAAMGRDPHAFTFAAVLVAFPAAAWAGWVASRRFEGRWPLALALANGLLALAPTCLGDPEASVFTIPFSSTYGMQYNRLLWALAGPAVLALVVPGRRGGRGADAAEALIAGFALGLAGLGKINFLVAAAPLALFGAWRRRFAPGYLIGCVAGIVCAFALLSPFASNAGYMRDVRELAAAQSPVILIGRCLARGARYLEYLLAAGVLAYLARGLWRPTGETRRDLWAVAALWIYGFVVTSSNYQHSGAPVFALGMIVAAAAISRQNPPERLARAAIALGAAALGLGVMRDVAGILTPVVARVAGEAQGGPATGIVLLDRFQLPGPKMAVVRHRYGEMADLARRAGLPAPVSILADHNFVPLMLGWPSPGGLLWYHEGRTVTDATMPPFDREFARTRYLLVPESNLDGRGRERSIALRTYAEQGSREFPRVVARGGGEVVRIR